MRAVHDAVDVDRAQPPPVLDRVLEKRPATATPALLTSTSTGACSASIRSATATTASWSPTSQVYAALAAPRRAHASAVARAAAPSRSIAITAAPARAHASDVAAPIPLPAPVTATRDPAIFTGMRLLSVGHDAVGAAGHRRAGSRSPVPVKPARDPNWRSAKLLA
jgi:hypothetical protein